MTSHPIDTETIHTVAGDYVLDFYVDENADQPCDSGFTIYRKGSRHYTEIEEGDIDPDAAVAVDNSGDTDCYYVHSPAAIARYLRIKGRGGVAIIDQEFDRVDETAQRGSVWGFAYAPDDASDPDEYTRCMLQQWKAWANGDTFGWKLIDPSGAEVDSCWGYYGLNDNSENSDRAYILEVATKLAEADAQDRIDIASRVGAGILGII